MENLFQERVELCNDIPECSTTEGIGPALVIVYVGAVAYIVQQCTSPGE